MEQATVQMRSLVRAETMVGGLKPRQVFWCTPAQAQHFIEHRIAELIAAMPAPQETKPAAPAETKVQEVREDDAKKSSPGEKVSPSTDSALSQASGQDGQSFVSRLGQVLTGDKPKRSPLTLPKKR